MPKNDEGEFELVLGNRQLISVFLIVVILLGVFFSMGYIVGRNSPPPLAAETARNDKAPQPETATPTPDTSAQQPETALRLQPETPPAIDDDSTAAEQLRAAGIDQAEQNRQPPRKTRLPKSRSPNPRPPHHAPPRLCRSTLQ